MPVPSPPFVNAGDLPSLRERMLDRLPADLDRAEGSLAWSLVSPAAVELAKVWADMDLLVRIAFAQTTYGGFLDARAEEHGVSRRSATRAAGEVTFTGSSGAVVPSGTRVSTTTLPGSVAQPIVFETTESGVLASGELTVGVVALSPGADGNVAASAIDRFVSALGGVVSVSNAAATAGGSDEETDEELRERLFQVLSAPTGAGTESDYVTWAQEVPGVGQATSQGLWDGPGTVRVFVLDADLDPADAGLLTLVEEYLEELRPIGADVTVVAPTPVSVPVAATLVVMSGFVVGAVQSAVEEAILAYFEQLRVGDDVVLNEVGAALLSVSGVVDYSALTLDAAAENFSVAADEIAKIGAVVLS